MGYNFIRYPTDGMTNGMIMHLIIILCVCLLLNAVQVAAACFDLGILAQDIHDGKVEISSTKRLGAGKSGVVMRVILRDGRSFADKTYQNPSHRIRDLQLLKKFKEAVKDLPEGSTFQIPDVEEIPSKNKLLVALVKGRDLHSLLMSGLIPESEKEELRKKFDTYRDRLIQALRDKGLLTRVALVHQLATENFFRDREHDGLRVTLVGVKGVQEEAKIKSDNIIVEEGSGQFFLIDPW